MNEEFLKQDMDRIERDIVILKERVTKVEVSMGNLEAVLKEMKEKMDNHTQKLYWVLGVLAIAGSIAGTLIAKIIFLGIH